MQIRNVLLRSVHPLCVVAALCASSSGYASDSNPFLGNWALTIPGGGAGWLGVTEEKGYYDASILWGGGSVLPVASVFLSDDGDSLWVTRINEVKRKDSSGKVVRTHQFTEAIVAKVSGDELSLTRFIGRENGHGTIKEQFTGKRIPPVPPANCSLMVPCPFSRPMNRVRLNSSPETFATIASVNWWVRTTLPLESLRLTSLIRVTQRLSPSSLRNTLATGSTLPPPQRMLAS